MKVLSLLEPWASLINDKIKFIETRSWKTNYRGELYIHISKKQLTKNDFEKYKKQISFLRSTNFKYGYIICKCNLVDCIYMTDSFINEIKENEKEYLSGEYKVGRYAWILENIQVLENPILAKGSLGIWNYKQ